MTRSAWLGAAAFGGLAWLAIACGRAPQDPPDPPAISVAMQEAPPHGVLVREPAWIAGGDALAWWEGDVLVTAARRDAPRSDDGDGEGAVAWQAPARADELQSQPWASGRLEARHAAALARSPASSSALRNGVLLEDGAVSGFAPAVAIAPGAEGASAAEGTSGTPGAADAPGPQGAHLVYDRAVRGDFEVVHRAPDGTQTVLADAPGLQAHADVVVDARGRTWVAWDEGLEPRGARAEDEAWGRGEGLHRERSLRLAVRLPSDADEAASGAARWRAVALPAFAAPLPGTAELPRLVADANGPLWLFFRVMETYEPGPERASARRAAWTIHASALTEHGWSAPVELAGSDGPNHDTLAVIARPGGGVLAAWTSDDRIERFNDAASWASPLMAPPKLRVAALRVDGGAPATLDGAPLAASTHEAGRNARTTASAPAIAPDPDPALAPPGFERLWGDLHRHSDLSRCKMETDGSVPDQYRYAFGAAGLDFVALTDHFQHLTPPVWEYLRASTRRFHDPPRHLTLYGFERALPGGHRNLVCADPDVARDAPFRDLAAGGGEPSLDAWDDGDFLAIPHQVADRFSILHWKEQRADLERLVEVYQGRRGSYEARDAPRLDFGARPDAAHVVDYLERGFRFGFIASSDHVSGGRSFAAAYVPEGRRDRESLFAALRARRTYAATARMALDVRLGEMLMGESGPVAPAARLLVRVDAGGPIARVEVLRRGVVAHAWHGKDLRRAGLLTVRVGRTGAPREVLLRGEGVAFGEPAGFDLEGPDEARAAPDSEVARAFGATLALSAELNPFDQDGWVVPVRAGADDLDDAVVHAKILRKEGSWRLGDLRTPLTDERLGGAAFSLHLAPPPLDSARLEESWAPGDWAPGDWVYVRVVRADGEMAWSSPIWITK